MSRKRRIVVCAAGVACAGLLIAGRLHRSGPQQAVAASTDPLTDGAIFPDLAGRSNADSASTAEESDANDLVFANVLSSGGRMRLAIGAEPTPGDDPVLSTIHVGAAAERSVRQAGPGSKAPKHVIGSLRKGGSIASLVAMKTSNGGLQTADHTGAGIGRGFDVTPIPAVNIVPPAIIGDPTPPETPVSQDPPPVTIPVDAPVAAVPLPPALPAGVAGLIAAALVARRWKRQSL